jgi:protein-tyrosine phosphatase
MSRIVLFLCTGNYFRSRFAEILFNFHAPRAGVTWSAESRGLAIEFGSHNIGPISRFTLEGLADRRIPQSEMPRTPIRLEESDLIRAARVVALKESEHRPLLARRFPDWVEGVDYWHVDDIDCAHPADSMAQIEQEVLRLLECLASVDDSNGEAGK